MLSIILHIKFKGVLLHTFWAGSAEIIIGRASYSLRNNTDNTKPNILVLKGKQIILAQSQAELWKRQEISSENKSQGDNYMDGKLVAER